MEVPKINSVSLSPGIINVGQDFLIEVEIIWPIDYKFEFPLEIIDTYEFDTRV